MSISASEELAGRNTEPGTGVQGASDPRRTELGSEGNEQCAPHLNHGPLVWTELLAGFIEGQPPAQAKAGGSFSPFQDVMEMYVKLCYQLATIYF